MSDSITERLINLLEKDARQNSEALAKQLSVSSSTIRRRVNKLIEQGIIRIVARTEPSKIGLPLRAIIAFNVDHSKINPLMQKLSSRSEVKWVFAVSGQFDFIAMTWFPSTDELFNFIERDIGKLEGVKRTETFICLHVEKAF